MNYDLMDEYISRVLKNEREKKGLLLIDVANDIGLSRQRLSNYEKGKRSLPIDIYINLCKYYNIDHLSLFEDAQKYMRETAFAEKKGK